MVYSYALGKAQTIIMRSTPSFRSSPNVACETVPMVVCKKLRALVYDILRCRKAMLGVRVVWWPLSSFQKQSPRASSLHAGSLLQTIARHALEFMSVHALLCVVCFCHTGKLPNRAECQTFHSLRWDTAKTQVGLKTKTFCR